MIKLETNERQIKFWLTSEDASCLDATAAHDAAVAHALVKAMGNASQLANVCDGERQKGAKFILDWLNDNAIQILRDDFGIEP